QRRGDLKGAFEAARQAQTLLEEAPLDRAAAQATLSQILLREKRYKEALDCASEAMRRLEALGTFGFRGSALRLVYIEILDAMGNHAAARQAVVQACA